MLVLKNLPARIKIVILVKCNLMFGGYVKMRESLYTLIIIWIKLILGRLCLYMKVLAWNDKLGLNLNDIRNINTVKYPYPAGINKCEMLITDIHMV